MQSLQYLPLINAAVLNFQVLIVAIRDVFLPPVVKQDKDRYDPY